MVEEVRAGTDGHVVRVVADVGDFVKTGDTLVTLGTQAGEVPVRAEKGGMVSNIAVHEGDTVHAGGFIALLD